MTGPLTGYEKESVDEVGAILDDSPADADEVYLRTIGLSERSIAAVAAKRAGSGGGGSVPATAGIAFQMSESGRNAIDLGPSGASGPLAFDQAFNNTYDFNSIAVLPDGIGLTLALDGSNGTWTTTEAGVWFFSISMSLANDATVWGFLGIANSDIADGWFGPGTTDQTGKIHYSVVLAYPAGAQDSFFLQKFASATADPLHPQALEATIVRLL